MNRIDFSHAGGFPLDTDTLQFLQKSYSDPIKALTKLGGNHYIISGVEDDGIQTSDGWVVIDGEIMPFKGDLKQRTIMVIENVETARFENEGEREVFFTRYATFGVSLNSIPFTSLARISDLQQQKKRADDLQTAHEAHKEHVVKRTGELQAAHEKRTTELQTAHEEHKKDLNKIIDLLKSSLYAEISTLQAKVAPFVAGGGMVLWQKPANLIPVGWCEVVDWRGRMPVGSDFNDTDFNIVGKTGGSKNVSIRREHLPDIQLKSGLSYNAGSYHDDGPMYDNIGNGDNNPIKTEKLGDGTGLNIMNPYRVVMFIEYVGLTKN